MKAAERTAVSIVVQASCGDVERMAMAAFVKGCNTCMSSSFVFCGGGMMAAQVPSSFAVGFLHSLAAKMTNHLTKALNLASPIRLPFWWWWGPTLDISKSHHYSVYND
jgi:hypothetical protein